MIRSLVDAKHEVSCFGIGTHGEPVDESRYLARVWSAGLPTDNLAFKCEAFLATESLDFLVINYDLITTLSWLRTLEEVYSLDRVICHVVIDGLPVERPFVEPLSGCLGLVVPSRRVAEFLRPHVTCPVHYFPHLVDLSVFAPSVEANGPAQVFTVGCIAQNRPRKQLQQVLIAIRQLVDGGNAVRLRLHTDYLRATKLGGDNLRRLVRSLDLELVVVATEYGPSSDAQSLNVADIIRACDCMVVVPTCGGFEYGIVEAQACGVPILLTSDAGILQEVSGGAAYMVESSYFEYLPYGAKSFRVPASSIAGGIAAVRDSPELQRQLRERGLANAATYSLSHRVTEFTSIVADITHRKEQTDATYTDARQLE